MPIARPALVSTDPEVIKIHATLPAVSGQRPTLGEAYNASMYETFLLQSRHFEKAYNTDELMLAKAYADKMLRAATDDEEEFPAGTPAWFGPAMGQALAPVVERLANLETDVAGLKTGVAGLKTDVAGLKTDVAGLKTGFVQMEQQMTELRAALTAGERRQSARARNGRRAPHDKSLSPLVYDSGSFEISIYTGKVISIDQIKSMKKDELVARLKGFGLDSTGVVDDLKTRLREFHF